MEVVRSCCWVALFLNISTASLVLQAEERSVPVLFAEETSAPDPLGIRLVRLFREHVLHPLTDHVKQEIARQYSPRHLARLLASAHAETRRAAVYAIGVIGDVQSQTEVALALHDPDEAVSQQAETSSWQIWVRMGSLEQQYRLNRIREYIEVQDFQAALAQVSLLIETSPEYAEAWNQRAIAYFQMQRFREAIPDCRRALELNPYHFGAASGLAQCHLRLNEIPEALDALRLTAKLHPRMPGVQEQITLLAARTDH